MLSSTPIWPYGQSTVVKPITSSQEERAEESIMLTGTSSLVVSAPDGGFVAWLQCASSFALFMGTWGIVSSFGVFQTYYEDIFPDKSSSQISWIGTIQVSLLIALGVFTGPLYDYGYLRSLVCTGSLLLVAGMMIVSVCTQYWQLILSQGVLVGLGSGCLFVPSIAVLPTYFEKRQSLALGIGASGSALGGIIFPVIFHELQPRIGFGWSIRTIAFIISLLFMVPVLGMRMLVRPSTARRIFDANAWKEIPFSLSSIFLFLLFMGAYIPPFYIQLYGIKNNIVGKNLGFYLLPLMNAGSFFGRIIPPYIADRAGVFNVEIVCVFLTGVLALAWIAVHEPAGIITFSIVYGFFSGAITSLSPNIAVALSPDMGVFGVRLGMLLIPISVGLLVGNPIAGAISATGWIGLQIFSGVLILVAAALVFVVRINMFGWSWRVKC